MKYLCIIHARSDAQAPEGTDWNAIKDGCIEDDNRLFDEGKLYAASPLEDGGAMIRYRDGQRSRTDGPFVEAKEWIAGFMLVDAASLDEAIAIADSGDLKGLVDIEVRPLREETHSKTGLDRSAFFQRG